MSPQELRVHHVALASDLRVRAESWGLSGTTNEKALQPQVLSLLRGLAVAAAGWPEARLPLVGLANQKHPKRSTSPPPPDSGTSGQSCTCAEEELARVDRGGMRATGPSGEE